MKTLKTYIIFLSILVLFNRCSLFQQDDEYESIDKEQEIISLINGVYNRLSKVHNKDYFVTLSRADDINIYDNYFYSVSRAGIIDQCGGGSGVDGIVNISNIAGQIYLYLYTAIANTNALIPVLDKPDDDHILGEVYFLRSYCYFKLARLFGTPPIITNIDVNFIVETPTVSEVYEFIESDMLKALELLPDTYTDARIPGETPHKGMAKAVLAEIYLAMAGFPVNDVSKYAEAARLAKEVIEQADYYNNGLLDDMADLWKNESKYNKENIFGLFFNSGTQNNINIRKEIDRTSSTNDLTNFNPYNTSFNFFIKCPNDYRKQISFVTGQYEEYILDRQNKDETTAFYRIYDPFNDPCEFIQKALSKKWIELQSYTHGNRWYTKVKTNEITLYLFRYAHTLLTYAEAQARSGNLDETCFETVNMVRRRANKVDIYSPSVFDLPSDLSTEQFLDSVVWERAWELCVEPEGRWFDMLRLHSWNRLNYFAENYDKYRKLSGFFNEDFDFYFYKTPDDGR